MDLHRDIKQSTQEGFSCLQLGQAKLSDNMQLLPQMDSGLKSGRSMQININTTSIPESNHNSLGSMLMKHETISIRDQDLINHFLTIQKRTKQRRTTKHFPSSTKSTEEEHFDYVLYPANILRRFGFAYGLLMQMNSTSWQFTLQPFNVIKETSPIFEFCRNGNVKAIQTLIGLREASVRDRDPYGRTPLWVRSLRSS